MRNSFLRILCVSLMMALAGAAGTVCAQQTNHEKSVTAPAGKNKHLPFKGTIASVDKTARTVTLEGAKKQVIHITSQTRITKNGNPAVADDITAGARVTGSKREMAAGQWEALSLKIGEAKKSPEKSSPAPAPVK